MALGNVVKRSNHRQAGSVSLMREAPSIYHGLNPRGIAGSSRMSVMVTRRLAAMEWSSG